MIRVVVVLPFRDANGQILDGVSPKLQAHDTCQSASADESVTSDARAGTSNLTSTIQSIDWQIPTQYLKIHQ